MNGTDSLSDLVVIGAMPSEQAAVKLRELEETELAEALTKSMREQEGFETPLSGRFDFLPFSAKPWRYTQHAYGFLAPTPPGTEMLPIQHAGNMNADMSLRNTRIKITLDRLRVADYPGGGVHNVLFDFYAQNQIPNATEDIHFNMTFKAYEGQEAAVIGYPIFIGLNVGTAGVQFRFRTVNVNNDQDEAFLGFLDSDVFKKGLTLATTAQPAIGVLSSMAVGITRSIAARTRNVLVQDVHMGLDFTNIPMGARLAQGSYIVVQIPDTMATTWDWNTWIFNPANGHIVSHADHSQLIPYNYIVLSISRYEE
jgi:hypothetical protein